MEADCSASDRRRVGSEWPGRTKWFFWCLTIGFALRLLNAGFLPSLPHDAAVFFLPDARFLSRHGLLAWSGLSVANPPLFSTLTAVTAKLIPDVEWAAILLSAVAGASIVWPIRRITESLFPGRPRVLWAAGLIAVVHPFLIRFASEPVADSMYALLFACAVCSGLEFLLRPTLGQGVRFGAWVGAAFLLRPEVLGLPFLATVGLVVLAWQRRAASARTVALGLAGVALAIAPSIAFNTIFVHERLGVWTLSPKAGVLVNFEKSKDQNILATLNAEKTMTLHEEALSSSAGFQSFSWAEFGEVDLGTRVRAFSRNLGEFGRYLVECGHPVVFVLMLWGIWVSRQGVALGTWRSGGLWIVLSLLFSYAIVLSIFYVSRRFVLPFLPLLIPWAALGLTDGLARLRRRRAAREPSCTSGETLEWAPPIPLGSPPGLGERLLVGLIVLVLLAGSVDRVGWADARWRSRPEKELGERIRDRFGTDQVIVSSKGRVTWYADGKHLFQPASSLDDLVTYMIHRGSRLLVIEERRRHRDEEFERALTSDARWEEVDRAVGQETTYRVFRLLL